MLPLPTERATAILVGLAATMTVGVLGRSETVILMAGVAALVLAGALATSFPLGRRVRRQRLEFAWWLGHGEAGTGPTAVVPHAPTEVRCYVRHRGSAPVLLDGVVPLMAEGARLRDAPRAALAPLPVTPRARTEFSFTLETDAVGRVVLHGLAVRLRGSLGLFDVPLYFPNPLSIKVLPRAAARRSDTLRAASDLPVDRSGRASRRRRGGGNEFYELRERKPGDPYRSIAWKASARLGKLVVREVEREVQEAHFVLVDVSGTMRGGPLGRRKLDHALDVAATVCRRALLSGDVVGLATIDDRLLGWVPPRDDPGQMIPIYDALVAATEVVDEDLTEVDDDQLAELVGRYVRNQDGVDFARPDARRGSPRADGGTWDVRGLVKHARRSLEREPDEHAPPPVATSRESAILRRFCRARGIPIPHRITPRDGAKGRALADALRRVADSRRGAQDVLMITDFDGVAEPSPVVSAAKLLRAHGHSVRVLVPDAEALAPPPRDALERDLHHVFGLAEERRLGAWRTALARVGVAVIAGGPRRVSANGAKESARGGRAGRSAA